MESVIILFRTICQSYSIRYFAATWGRTRYECCLTSTACCLKALSSHPSIFSSYPSIIWPTISNDFFEAAIIRNIAYNLSTALLTMAKRITTKANLPPDYATLAGVIYGAAATESKDWTGSSGIALHKPFVRSRGGENI